MDRQQTDLKISWDYQKDLRETWKNNTRPSIYVDASTADWSGYLWKDLR